MDGEAWYDPAVGFVAALDLMKGTGKDTFEPGTAMTRAMVVTVLYRLEGEPSVKGLKCDFTDLTQDWYKDAVVWAANVGVTNGMSKTEFAPNVTINREQMATMLSRYLNGELGKVPTGDAKAALEKDLAKLYSDCASISDWALEPVLEMNELGLMQGDKAADGKLPTFRPQDGMKRSECAQVLMNMFELVPNGWLPADEDPADEGGDDTKPADGDDTKPADGDDTKPADGGDTTPADGGDTTPAEGGDTTPAEGGDTTPAEGGDTTPAEGGDTTPAEGGEG